MSLTDKTLRKELEKYSKADIIGALCATFNADYTVRSMLNMMHRKAFDRAQKAEENAFKEEMDASTEYIEWLGRMAKEYGDGKKVDLARLPDAEIKKGSELAARASKARRAAVNKMNAVNKMCGMQEVRKDED